MPRPIALSDDKIDWLKQNHSQLPYQDQAAQINCCVDTLKRILVRLGLQEFDGAKYALKREFAEKIWSRPCINCKDTGPRPKNHYYCKPCRLTMGYED